jgi:hypothetical protein
LAERSGNDGGKKAGHREEHEATRKTIARGMPDDSGVTVVTMLVCFLNFAREAADASAVRHSLRPLFWAEPARPASRISRRDRITVCAV